VLPLEYCGVLQEAGMLIVYQGICVLLAILIAAVTLRERNLSRQITGGLVLILLLLRMFLIK
jgi:hypothetical protein